MKTVFLTTICPEDQFVFEFDKQTDIFEDEVWSSLDAAKAHFSDLSGFNNVKWVKKENIWEGTGLNPGFRILDSGDRESVNHILFIKEVPLRGLPHEKDMKVYQCTLKGYEGDTDEQDHLIKWIKAPSKDALNWFLERYMIPVREYGGFDELDPMYGLDDGVDVILNEEGYVILGNIGETKPIP